MCLLIYNRDITNKIINLPKFPRWNWRFLKTLKVKHKVSLTALSQLCETKFLYCSRIHHPSKYITWKNLKDPSIFEGFMSKTLPPINLSFRICLSFENRVNDYVIAPLWIQCTPCASSWRGPKRTNITSCERSDSPSPGLDKSLLLQALVHKGLLKKTTLLFRPVFSRAFQKAMARNIFRSWGGTVSKTKFKPLISEP